MKKEYLKKSMAIVLAGAMLMTTGGCGNQKNTEESKAVDTESAQDAEEPTQIRIFSAYSEADEPDTSKFLVSELEKATNIKLIRDEVPTSAYQEKLQLAMSDGDYPDVFVFNNHQDTLLLSAIDDGLIIPINEYLGDGKYPNIEKYTYDEAWEAARVKNDENIYLLPRCTVSRVDGFVVRQDWMDKLGIELSSKDTTVTKEEFLDMMQKFCEEDPDGDGAKNTYGIVYKPDGSGNLNTFCDGAFNCLGWQDSTGEYAYMDKQYQLGDEDYKELLEYNQKLYQYTHPDSIVTTDDNVLFNSGQVGAKVSFAGHVSESENKAKEVNPNASCTYVAGVVNDDGVLQGAAMFPGIWGGLAITKNCKNPEKILEMVDWLLSDQAWEYALWGEPGVTYEKEADGTCKVTDAEKYTNSKFFGVWATIIARRKEDTNFFIDLSLPEDKYTTIKGWLDTAVESVTFSKNYGKLPEIASDTTFVEAENARKEAVTKIIMGAMSADEYESVLQNWYDKGGKTYVEQMNTIIESMDK